MFWDVAGSIKPGEAFDLAIERATASCDVLLPVIGRQWLTCTDAAGQRRIDDPHDFVRLEIGTALRRKIPVIPVLVQRAVMPAADDLPQNLRPLARRQAVELSDGRWDADVSLLIDALDKVLSRPPRRWRRHLKTLVLTTLAAIGGLGLWLTWANIQSPVRSDPSTASQGTVQVPDIRQLPLDTARDRLSKAGLRIGHTDYFTLGRHSPNTVFEQWIAPGTNVLSQTAVGVTVEREKRPGVYFSGRTYLSPDKALDLDGENKYEQDADVKLEGKGSDNLFGLVSVGTAEIIDALGARDRTDCESALLRGAAHSVLISHDDKAVCVRTNRGRYVRARLDVSDLASASDDVPPGYARIDFDTWLPPSAPTGVLQARFFENGGYHLLTGALAGRNGDFYLERDSKTDAYKFMADQEHQRGLVSLGKINTPLDGVAIPKGGYDRFGIPVVVGHTYVSRAPAGEEGHFVVFRVTRVEGVEVVFSYIYR